MSANNHSKPGPNLLKRKKRACITCKRKFMSDHDGVRMCDPCRRRSASAADTEPYRVLR